MYNKYKTIYYIDIIYILVIHLIYICFIYYLNINKSLLKYHEVSNLLIISGFRNS